MSIRISINLHRRYFYMQTTLFFFVVQSLGRRRTDSKQIQNGIYDLQPLQFTVRCNTAPVYRNHSSESSQPLKVSGFSNNI